MYKLENNVAWTSDLKNAFKHNMTRASILYDNTEINEENNLVDLTLTEERYIPNYGFIGSATARKLNVTIQNTNTSINLENKDLTLKIGAVYNNSTYYINYGNFIVYDPPQTDETNGKVTIVAYDYMKKFDKPYVDRVNYPTTLSLLLDDICDQAGVTLATSNFPNKTFIVENNQFEGNTLREVLMNIAKCAFSWARIGQDNRLYLDFNLTAENTETITIDEYKLNAFKKSNKYYGPVNRVVYADSDIEGQEEEVHDAESIEDYGLKELTIYDNLFAYTPEKRQTLIQAGTRLFGLTYMPVSQLELIGFIYLDCNDIINIGTLDNQTYTTRVFNHIIKYNGTTSDSITSEGTSNNEDTYKNTASNVFQDLQTKAIVDKANKRIALLTSEVTDHESRISQMQIDIDGIQTEVSGVYDLARAVTGTRQVTLEDCLKGYILEMHIKGNNYVFENDADITVTDSQSNSTTYSLGVVGVLRANNEVYDEYIVKDNHAQVIRRVNSDGTTKITEVIEDLGDITINVAQGNNTIRITNYYADMSVKYIPKNNYTDQFVATLELGTKIIQNQDSVKIAWNQISDAIKMMIINNNVSLAIIDQNNRVIASFDKTGQHFYESNQNILGDVGVKQVTEYDQQGQEQTYNYIAFSLPVQYASYTRQGMAWGVETPDKKFWPVMFIRNFYMAQQQAGDFGGQVELNNCDLVIGSTSGITNNSIKLTGEPTGELVFTSEVNNPMNLLTLYPEGHYLEQYGALKMLNNIWFFKNQAGTNSFRVGNQSQYVLMTDDGDLDVTGELLVRKAVHLGIGNASNQYYGATLYGNSSVLGGNFTVFGNVYADNIGSDRRIKTDIKDCNVSALDKIKQIQHKQFIKITDNKHYDIGYIAQDMEKIDSNFVIVNENSKDKQYYINELPIIATLTKAIQEQQKQIDELTKEVQKLKGGA